MGFIKKVLGIEELESNVNKKLNTMEGNLKTSWNWISYLHELEQDNKQKIKNLIEENKELKELIKEKNTVLVPEQSYEKKELKIAQKSILNENAEGIEESSIKIAEPIAAKSGSESEIAFKNIDISGIGKNEAFILQILYQMACFDASSSIETPRIHDNLPYNITIRGLRKKMYKLEEQGIVSSVMIGNSRRWFLDMGKISKLKEFLKAKA